mgnify:CR=1 FL=1
MHRHLRLRRLQGALQADPHHQKSAHGYSYITQIGTGNYNEKTSELYTDYSFITADLGIGEEASNVFQNLAVQKLTEESEKMLVRRCASRASCWTRWTGSSTPPVWGVRPP